MMIMFTSALHLTLLVTQPRTVICGYGIRVYSVSGLEIFICSIFVTPKRFLGIGRGSNKS